MGVYTTIDEMREEGLTERECPDDRLTLLIQQATDYIEDYTKCYFEPRNETMYLDAPRMNALMFPVPIISITSVDLVDETRTVVSSFAANEYVVYNRHLTSRVGPDDRLNPKIEMIGGGNMRPLYRTMQPFTKGLQNIKVVGVFGWTAYSSSVAQGVTPSKIKEICQKLILKNAPRKGDNPKSRYAQNNHRLSSETANNTIYVLQRQTEGVFTGDISIDRDLLRFMVPRFVGGT